MSTHTKKKGRRLVSIAIALVMLLALTLGVAPAMAADNDPIRVVWVEADIDVTITDEQRKDPELFTMVGPHTYVETNTAGTFRYSQTPPTGITVKDLLEFAEIHTNTLDPERVITFIAQDSVRVSFTWGQLSEKRYRYTVDHPNNTALTLAQFRACERGEELPAIISFNQGGTSPRNFMGITYPEEQFRGVMNQSIATIEIGGLAEKWGTPYVFLEAAANSQGDGPATPLANGAVVEAGTKLRITNDTHKQGGQSHKYFYTTNGSDPVPGNPDTTMFNFNSNGPTINANPSIVVPEDDGSGKFTVKAITYGYGMRTSDVATYTFNYPYEEKVAFLTGPAEVNIDVTDPELEYKVNVANVDNINMFEIKMSYDEGKLSFDESNVLLPSSLSGWVLDEVDNATAGELYLVVSAGESGAALTLTDKESAEVVGLTFSIDSGVSEGETIKAELLEVNLYDPVLPTPNKYEATITGGEVNTVAVTSVKYDINKDGVFDLLDLAIIIYNYFMVDDTEALWSKAQAYNIVKGSSPEVIDTADIIALYSLIAK